ncbi:hydroxyisourate hydrolase [Chroococcus sp. FPU101]|uniref:hydroxyisourate hydrolase n=1 Tax=Chroococcus sp. FPU101 TaxID=1974212 RepID=UPI001A8C700A|nr:hydroxyisourate hydrolase [Chroococcus sp. FPU101]GFE68035.1 5-hydroxyisourate hydrolase [Chroococcus sp. FPU101]
MPGKLTTHILDTAHGCPAAGVTIELWSVNLETNQKSLVKTVMTNADGRTNEPLLSDGTLKAGVYGLVFMVGDYFKNSGVKLADPPFLDKIPVQFGIADPNVHYHVPLLVSPWSYSTYRGS